MQLTHGNEGLEGAPEEGVQLEAGPEVASSLLSVVEQSVAPPQQPEGNGGITGVVGSEVCLCALLEREEGLEGQDCSIGTGREWGWGGKSFDWLVPYLLEFTALFQCGYYSRAALTNFHIRYMTA